MGTPNRLRAILGSSESVKASDVTHKQWVDLLWEALSLCCGPQLKYLLDFTQFGEFAHGYVREGVQRTVAYPRCRFTTTPSNFEFGGGTQCVLLATTPEEKWTDKNDPASHSTGRFIKRRHLLLTRGGNVLEWRWLAEEDEKNFGEVLEVAVISEIILDGTMGLATSSTAVAREAFLTLQRLLAEKLKKSEGFLASMRDVVNPINQVASQILTD